MKSKDLLRVWSQSTWPEDEFTALQNKEDLGSHVQDNIDHSAYGYMIYSLDQKTCYGSLYVNPLSSVLENYILDSAQEKLIQEHQARIDFWIVEGERELEKDITRAIQDWLLNEWKINPLFSAREGMILREEIYSELGLKKVLHLRSKVSEATLLLYDR
ncbi:hypothetical protein [Bdellovibrio bacteriovorus]|uniref:hypothetical protein n=1 Tax=Bdellovibrio bacteriovorus TaxID=959 RepID=UPI0035A5E534